jgi:hypothetical protein
MSYPQDDPETIKGQKMKARPVTILALSFFALSFMSSIPSGNLAAQTQAQQTQLRDLHAAMMADFQADNWRQVRDSGSELLELQTELLGSEHRDRFFTIVVIGASLYLEAKSMDDTCYSRLGFPDGSPGMNGEWWEG